tara:strand:+ start:1926 stop:2603 length:678 start_codon:yes stop_codon:yes gene_type:complete
MNNNILLEPLKNFYSTKKNLELLVIILNNKNSNLIKNNNDKKISLRLIDWFVTNYCKKYKISIQIKKNKKVNFISIYDSYKSNLKAFSKKAFDPFRRKEKIFLNYDLKEKKNNKDFKIVFTNNNIRKYNFIDTTIGQLNFFKWIIDNDIYTYIRDNKKSIENDMINSQKENNIKKLDKKNLITKVVKNKDGSEKIVTRKKRNELSKSKSNNLHLAKGTRTVYFDN